MSGLLIVIILLWVFRNISSARPRRRGMFFGPMMGGWHVHPGPGPGPRSFGGFGSPFRGGGGGRAGGFGGFTRSGGGGFTRGGGGGRFR